MILFRCECGEELEAAEYEAGRTLMCPLCERKVQVPGGRQESIVAGTPVAAPAATDHVAEPASPAVPTNPAAQASLVLALISFCLPIAFVSAIPAILFGIVGLRAIRRSEIPLAGKGLAIAGITLGAVTIAGAFALIPVVLHIRQSAENTLTQNHLKQIGLALVTHADIYKTYPQQAIYSKDGKPLLSWRVKILPYIEQNDLYLQFKLDEPWDSPHNKMLLPLMPDLYKTPGRPELSADFATLYQGFVGKNTFFRATSAEKLTSKDLAGDAEKMLMVVEARSGVPWTKPEDLAYDPDRPLPILGPFRDRGFNAVLVDGTATYFDADTSEKTLREAIAGRDPMP